MARSHLGQHGPVGAAQDEPVDGVDVEHEPAVAAHELGHVDEQGLGHRVAGPAQEGVDHLLGVVAGGAGVPQAEGGEPVGVDVLGRALELGEGGDVGPAGGAVGMVDVEQQGAVGLDDERPRGGLAGGLDAVMAQSTSSSASVRTRAHETRPRARTRLSHPERQLDDHFAPADVEDGHVELGGACPSCWCTPSAPASPRPWPARGTPRWWPDPGRSARGGHHWRPEVERRRTPPAGGPG